MKLNKVFSLMAFFFLCSFFSSVTLGVGVITGWAKSVVAGSKNSNFSKIAKDSNGNIYAVGYIQGTGTYSFGNGVTVAGTYSGSNAVLVKYDSSGNAGWAKSIIAGSNSSSFGVIALDSSGNIYVGGSISGTSTYNFGNSVTVAGAYSSGGNAVLVKYDSSGNAGWAKSVIASSNNSSFSAIVLDSSGNIYVGGSIVGAGTYNFGNSITVAGTYSYGNNAMLIKYDGSGNAQWAKSTTSSNNDSEFSSVAVDSVGSIYVGGYIEGTGAYNFGSGVTVAGAYSAGKSALFIKYDSSGNAQWAKSVVSGSNYSKFNSVSVDSSGNIYAGGYVYGTGTYNFGNGVTVAVAYSYNINAVLVKYNSSGNAEWAKGVVAGGFGSSQFYSVAIDSGGSIYAGGYIYGTSYAYDFGNSVTATGAYSGGYNAVLVRFYQGPAIYNILKTVCVNSQLQFSGNDFTFNFSSPRGGLSNIQILTLPANGVLKLSGSAVTTNQIILAANLDKLTFDPNSGYSGSVSFSYNASDGTEYASSPALINIAVSSSAPALTNFSITGYTNSERPFTANDFVSNFHGCSCAGSNCLTKIKITSLPSPSGGTLKLLGTAVVTNQEIALANIGDLTFVPNSGWIGSTSFGWNANDGTNYSVNNALVTVTINNNNDWIWPVVGGVGGGAAVAVGMGVISAAAVGGYCLYKKGVFNTIKKIDQAIDGPVAFVPSHNPELESVKQSDGVNIREIEMPSAPVFEQQPMVFDTAGTKPAEYRSASSGLNSRFEYYK